MSVPDELYEKRVRGRAALLACRGCGAKIRLDGTAGGPPPKVTGGVWLGEAAEEPIKPRDSGPGGAVSGRQPLIRVGRYALFEQFASGGMATVHFGRLDGAGGFSRVVAIKRLLPQLVQNDDFTQMLLKEARLAARVRNPNVVPTVDVVASKGEVLLVLEYVHGESLSALCRTQARERKEHVPVDIAAGVMRDVLAGLAAVHDASDEQGRPLGLVHRDISPPNVMVGADGHTRVLDFGIAKALEHIEDSNPNRVKGKSGYMSPEQIRGERLTQRSDVFSAGIILWELLATRRMFTADVETERMQKILDGGYPKPSSHRPDLNTSLDAVTARALELDPDKRFQNCREFASALEAAATGASSLRIAQWVNDLASEVLAARARMVAQVETWSSGAEDLPLNSTPFAAEVATLMSAPPPGTTNPPPAVQLPPAAALPKSVPPPKPVKADAAPDSTPSFRPGGASMLGRVVVGAVIAAGIAAAYIAMR
jgi:serine/threonine-protein kinase